MNNEIAIIEIRDLKKIYRTEEIETHALNGINLTINSGEYVAVMGPSGCGKSSLLAILGLLDHPNEGEYRLKGKLLAGLNQTQLAHLRNQYIGFIFQAFNLIADLNVFDNIELPLIYRGKFSTNERRKKVETVLEKVGMAHRMKHYPNQLSGGQQQRIAVARALINDPDILLADEPTGNLDSNSGKIVMDLLDSLHEDGATILMVTHDEKNAYRAGRTVQLHDGEIVSTSAH